MKIKKAITYYTNYGASVVVPSIDDILDLIAQLEEQLSKIPEERRQFTKMRSGLLASGLLFNPPGLAAFLRARGSIRDMLQELRTILRRIQADALNPNDEDIS